MAAFRSLPFPVTSWGAQSHHIQFYLWGHSLHKANAYVPNCATLCSVLRRAGSTKGLSVIKKSIGLTSKSNFFFSLEFEFQSLFQQPSREPRRSSAVSVAPFLWTTESMVCPKKCAAPYTKLIIVFVASGIHQLTGSLATSTRVVSCARIVHATI